jgi:hypothetical protein
MMCKDNSVHSVKAITSHQLPACYTRQGQKCAMDGFRNQDLRSLKGNRWQMLSRP